MLCLHFATAGASNVRWMLSKFNELEEEAAHTGLLQDLAVKS